MNIRSIIFGISLAGLLLPASFVMAQEAEVDLGAIIEELQGMQEGLDTEGAVELHEIVIAGEDLRDNQKLTETLQGMEIDASAAFLESDERLLVLAAQIAAQDQRITEILITAQESRISYIVESKLLGVIDTAVPFSVSSDLTEEVLSLSLDVPWWNFATLRSLGDLSILKDAAYDTAETASLKTMTFSDYLRMIQAQALLFTEETIEAMLSS